MKIRSIRIENFRAFRDETIPLNPYTCFVGPNGAGKSTVLAALSVFFREQSGPTSDAARLAVEDYHCKDTSTPVRITLTFYELSASAQSALAAYVRHDELVVTAEAMFDANAGSGQVKHYGQRHGITEFRRYFDAEKSGAKAIELGTIFDELRQVFPDLPTARSKDEKAFALSAFEEAHPDRCVPILTEDSFYGANGTGKLSEYVQWVYVPAVKRAADEGQETKNSALGRLVLRAAASRANLEDALRLLREDTVRRYTELLAQHRDSLQDLSQSLERRLEEWAHPGVRLDLDWINDPGRSVAIQGPVAGVKTGDGDFLGNLDRMGHGLQRSYLLALLQELTESDVPGAPTLILGCDEPELHQHPPQARHMAEVLSRLASGNRQILVTTHSPMFVSGDGFENVRLVRRTGSPPAGTVSSLTFDALCSRIRSATGQVSARPISGLLAKIHQSLQPGLAEMLFARLPVLVEGLEDAAYITAVLQLSSKWPEFMRLGCHIIPTHGKSKLVQPLAIAKELRLPTFVVFDADGNVTAPDKRKAHEADNRAIMSLLDLDSEPFPSSRFIGDQCAIWPINLTDTVRCDFTCTDYQGLTEAARLEYAQEGGLEKNEKFIVEWLTAAYGQGLRSATLECLCDAILRLARSGR